MRSIRLRLMGRSQCMLILRTLGSAMMNRWTVFLFEIGSDNGLFTPKVIKFLSVSRWTMGRGPIVGSIVGFLWSSPSGENNVVYIQIRIGKT